MRFISRGETLRQQGTILGPVGADAGSLKPTQLTDKGLGRGVSTAALSKDSYSWEALQVPGCCQHRGINQLLLLPFSSAAPSPPNSKHRIFQNQKLGKRSFCFPQDHKNGIAGSDMHMQISSGKHRFSFTLNYCVCMSVDTNTTMNKKHSLCGLIAKMQTRSIHVLNTVTVCLYRNYSKPFP